MLIILFDRWKIYRYLSNIFFYICRQSLQPSCEIARQIIKKIIILVKLLLLDLHID